MITMNESPPLSRQDIVNLVRLYGNAASDAILDPKTKIFNFKNVKGLIGYRLENECIVAYGDPVCAESDLFTLVTAFQAFFKGQNKSIVYLVASESFANWVLSQGFGALVEYGEELYIDPFNDPKNNTGVNAQLVRRKFRRAEKEDVKIFEYTGNDKELEKAINLVGDNWLKARDGPQIHISNIFLFDDKKGKRWLYAKNSTDIIGVVVLNRLEEKKGWLINHLMTNPDSPSGTSEMLIITALDILREENCHYATFGNVPAQNIVNIIGLSSFKSAMVRWIYSLSKKIFRLESKKMFWTKFNPESKKSYLIFESGTIGLKELKGLITALNIKF